MAREKITTPEMECALAAYFNYRQNLIVPNVYWGFSYNMHECDLLIVSKAGYCTEVEIKVTRADLKKDRQKWHGHDNEAIKYLYFAMPEYLDHCLDLVPERAGIILVRVEDNEPGVYPYHPKCRKVRAPKCRKGAHKMGEEMRYKVARLGALRIWNLKRKLIAAK